jgi:hypothetical protein
MRTFLLFSVLLLLVGGAPLDEVTVEQEVTLPVEQPPLPQANTTAANPVIGNDTTTMRTMGTSVSEPWQKEVVVVRYGPALGEDNKPQAVELMFLKSCLEIAHQRPLKLIKDPQTTLQCNGNSTSWFCFCSLSLISRSCTENATVEGKAFPWLFAVGVPLERVCLHEQVTTSNVTLLKNLDGLESELDWIYSQKTYRNKVTDDPDQTYVAQINVANDVRNVPISRGSLILLEYLWQMYLSRF